MPQATINLKSAPSLATAAVPAKPGAPVSVSAAKPGISAVKPAISAVKADGKPDDATAPVQTVSAASASDSRVGGAPESPVFAIAAAAATLIALGVQLWTMLG